MMNFSPGWGVVGVWMVADYEMNQKYKRENYNEVYKHECFQESIISPSYNLHDWELQKVEADRPSF